MSALPHMARWADLAVASGAMNTPVAVSEAVELVLSSDARIYDVTVAPKDPALPWAGVPSGEFAPSDQPTSLLADERSIIPVALSPSHSYWQTACCSRNSPMPRPAASLPALAPLITMQVESTVVPLIVSVRPSSVSSVTRGVLALRREVAQPGRVGHPRGDQLAVAFEQEPLVERVLAVVARRIEAQAEARARSGTPSTATRARGTRRGDGHRRGGCAGRRR